MIEMSAHYAAVPLAVIFHPCQNLGGENLRAVTKPVTRPTKVNFIASCRMCCCKLIYKSALY